MYEVLLVLSVAIFAATTVVYLREPSASIFHPVTFYLLFHGLVFVVRPIFGWYYGFDRIYVAMKFTPSLWDKAQALICTNLALVVFVTVTLLLVREPLRFVQDRHDLTQRRMLTERFLPIAVVLGAVAAYSMIWLLDFRESGEGFTDFDLRTGARAMTATNGYFFAAGTMLAAIVAIIAFLGRFTPWSMAPFVVFAVYRFATGMRGPVIAAAVTMALLYMYDKRKKWPTWTVVLAAIVIVPAFDAIKSDRGAGLRESFGYEIAETDRIRFGDSRQDKPFESMDIAMLEMVEFVTWSIPERSGSYDYFLGNLQVLTEPIPRVLWPGKPVGAPIKMFDLYSHAVPINGVMSVPGIGWTYWGYPGVAIWSAVFALIYGTAYKAFALSRQSNIAVLAYMIFLSTAVIAYRDGLVLTILKQSLFYLGPLAMLMIISRITKLPERDLLAQLSAKQALEDKGLPVSPSGRRSLLIRGQEPLASPSGNAQPGPRERRRARAGLE